MPRVKKSRVRVAEVVTTSKIIIAPEGVSTEVDYFSGLIKYFDEYKSKISKRYEQLVDVIVIERGKNEVDADKRNFSRSASSPDAVIEYASKYLIENYKDNFNSKIDYLCVVIDSDHWGDAKIALANKLCKQKNFHLFISSPSFELWLLLHFCDVSRLDSAEKNKIFLNKTPPRQQSYLKQLLKNYIDGFNYNSININDFLINIENAVSNAKLLNPPARGDWQPRAFTQIHELIELLPSIQRN